jgi:hypothetical protein
MAYSGQMPGPRNLRDRPRPAIGTLQELHAVGGGFASLTEALEMTTPGGRALFTRGIGKAQIANRLCISRASVRRMLPQRNGY